MVRTWTHASPVAVSQADSSTPGQSAVQLRATQLAVPPVGCRHIVPHAPQFARSDAVSTHSVPQRVRPSGHRVVPSYVMSAPASAFCAASATSAWAASPASAGGVAGWPQAADSAAPMIRWMAGNADRDFIRGCEPAVAGAHDAIRRAPRRYPYPAWDDCLIENRGEAITDKARRSVHANRDHSGCPGTQWVR